MTEQQQHLPDPNDILGGGASVPTAKWPRTQPGLEIGGRIVESPTSYQEREYVKDNPGAGKPKFFPSGDPIYGIKVTVQTSLRDPSIEDDDGKRRLFIEGKRMKEAVKAAVAATGQKLLYGGELYITFTGIEGDIMDPQAPKGWAARYVPPSAVQANAVLDDNAPAVAGVANPSNAQMLDAWAGQGTVQAPPVTPLPAQPAGPDLSVAQGGIPQAVWDTMTAEARAAVAGLQSQT